MRFQAKTLVVLGGASGIGEAVVRLAATEDPANLIIYDRNAETGEKLAAELGGTCRFTRLDITDASAIWKVLSAEDERNEIDHAIICAGVVAPCGILGRGDSPKAAFEYFANEFRRQTEVNLLGNGNFLAALLQFYVRRRRGFATIVSSAAASTQMANRTPYAAGKAGLSRLITNAANDLYVDGLPDFKNGKIVVNGVEPARVRTALMDNNLRIIREGEGGKDAADAALVRFRASQHSGEIMSPEFIAEQILRANTTFHSSGTLIPLGGPANFFE